MAKIKNYIKNNKLYIIVMTIGLLAFAFQLKYVVYYADDFSSKISTNSNWFIDIIKECKSYYMTWGGTLCFWTLFLKMFDITVWKLVNCVMIFTSIILIVRMVTYNNKLNKGLVALIMWLSIYVLDLLISREVLYWLNGNTAYIVTLFKTLIYFYYLFSKIIMKKKLRKYDYILLPLLALWAGWTQPQCGAVIVFSSFLILFWSKFINKDKIKLIYLITVAFCLIGFLILYFAPGNYLRMAVFTDFNQLNTMERIAYRSNSIFDIFFNLIRGQEVGRVPFYLFILLGVLICVGRNLIKTEKKKGVLISLKISIGILIMFLFLKLSIQLNIINSNVIAKFFTYNNILELYKVNAITFKALLPYFISALIILCSLYVSLYISLIKKQPLLFITVVSGFLSQFLMLMAPASDSRTTFIAVFYFSIAIAILIKLAYENKISIISAFILTFAICNTNLGIFCLLIYVIFDTIQKKGIQTELLSILVILTIIAVPKYIETVKKYMENSIIYNENMRRINEFSNSNNENSTNELYLLKPIHENYGFTPLIGTEWVESAVRTFYNLKTETIFVEDTFTDTNLLLKSK